MIPGFYINNKEIKSGDTILDFRGDSFKYLYLTANHTKVYVEEPVHKKRREFYPSVFRGEIK